MRNIFISLLLLISAKAQAISGSTYIPGAYPLDASKVIGAGQGVSATAAANTTTSIDLDITDDTVITGLEEIVMGATSGDYVVLSVVLTANKSITLATPVPGPWYLSNNADIDFHMEIPIKIQAGWTLRITYHNTSLLGTPFVAINYKLWKVLI